MRQIALAILAGLSLVLLMGAALLWVRSYWVSDQWVDSRTDRYITARAERGSIMLYHTTLVFPPAVLRQLAQLGWSERELADLTRPRLVAPAGRRFQSHPVRPAADVAALTAPTEPGVTRNIRLLGFHWYASEGGVWGNTQGWGGRTVARPHMWIVVPLWAVVLLSLPMPLLWLRANRRSRRWARRGLCPGCGYDVRESPERCPECGREHASKIVIA